MDERVRMGPLAEVRLVDEEALAEDLAEPVGWTPPQRLIREPQQPRPVPEALEARTFRTKGFAIVDVPPGVRFVRLELAPVTWEVQGPDGRRIALIQQKSWDDASAPIAMRSGDAALVFIEARTVHLDRWGGGPADVILERAADDRYLYSVERLAGERSAWLWRHWRRADPWAAKAARAARRAPGDTGR